MKILKFENNEVGKEAWLNARKGKVTGTRLKDLIGRGNKPKIGFYEIIAERVAIPAGEERAIDRGIRLEDEALERFEKETGKKVNKDLVLWCRDDNPNIALSPDGSVGKTVAVEAKCLSSAKHLEAYLTKELPAEYEPQKIQYFIVNEKLQTLYVAFYDPRMPVDFFYFTVKRKDVKDKVKEYLKLEEEALKKIDQIEKSLTF